MDYEKILKEALENDSTPFEVASWIEEQFPELKESEDERIRKEIIDFLTDGIWNTTIIDKVKQSQRYAKWIVYLDKQKEPKDVSASTIIPSCWREEEIKQEDSEDERIRKAIGAAICGTTAETILEANGATLVDALAYLEKQKEQKPAEWSEEDEEHFDSIIESYKELLKDYSANHGVDYIPYNTPVVARTVLNDIKFLKSLRPQPHWKPSEEQMEALKHYVDTTTDGEIELLYNDLKKL